ncbi:DUF883 family protein [Duganella qianjiadongensis]|uniref:DUF883 family protein n=1 Tax=Duganella qianjiadongensis TaxID=2692176 RepID=A0ABW9VHH8_9BURK|nr:DUF883 family protein [Duganella qianjiadongensis]MYM38928.1 DUF883 family protein [Duganella qianjiadongensis]
MEHNHQNGKDIAQSKAASSNARERLMSELKTAIDAAEGWLQQDDGEHDGEHNSKTGGSTTPSAAQAQFQETLSTARKDLQQLQQSLQARGRSAAQSAGAYVQENPWKSVALGATLGIIAGLLIARK